MKQIKKWVKSAFFSAVLYVLLLLLVSFLVLRGTVGEEQVGVCCLAAAALSSFVSALVYRAVCKDGTFASSVLSGGGFFLFALLLALLFNGGLLWKRVVLTLALAAAAGAAANALYAKSGLGKKRRGKRGRSANR